MASRNPAPYPPTVGYPPSGYPSPSGYPQQRGYPPTGAASASETQILRVQQEQYHATQQSPQGQHQHSSISHNRELSSPQSGGRPREDSLRKNHELVQIQAEHDAVLDDMAAELEQAEEERDAARRDCRAWQEHAWSVAESLNRQKGGAAASSTTKRPYGDRERRRMQTDIENVLEMLRTAQDHLDIMEQEGNSVDANVLAQKNQIEALQQEIVAVRANEVGLEQQKLLSNQTAELNERNDFFKRNSEKLSAHVQALTSVNEQLKDEVRAKEGTIRELQSLVSALGH